MTLTPEKKNSLFKLLADNTLYEAGVKLGMDKHYKTTNALKQAVYRHYNEVKNNPEKFAITQETVDLVSNIVSNRSTTTPVTSQEKTLAEKKAANELAEVDIGELVTSGRDKAFKLLHKKLGTIERSKKELKDISLSALTTAAAILFDKGQIIAGQATENIAVLAKVDKDMSPQDALDYVLRAREINVTEKARK